MKRIFTPQLSSVVRYLLSSEDKKLFDSPEALSLLSGHLEEAKKLLMIHTMEGSSGGPEAAGLVSATMLSWMRSSWSCHVRSCGTWTSLTLLGLSRCPMEHWGGEILQSFGYCSLFTPSNLELHLHLIANVVLLSVTVTLSPLFCFYIVLCTIFKKKFMWISIFSVTQQLLKFQCLVAKGKNNMESSGRSIYVIA